MKAPISPNATGKLLNDFAGAVAFLASFGLGFYFVFFGVGP